MRTYAPYFTLAPQLVPERVDLQERLRDLPRQHALVGRGPLRSCATPPGGKLYIPFGCSGGTCPQYAADIGNPEFRAAWIEEARSQLAHGYKGPLRRRREHLHAGLQRHGHATWRRSTRAPARDDAGPRGSATSPTSWQSSAPRSRREIVHNSIWFAGDSRRARPARACAGRRDQPRARASTTPASPAATGTVRAAHAAQPTSTTATPRAARSSSTPTAPTEAARLYGLAALLPDLLRPRPARQLPRAARRRTGGRATTSSSARPPARRYDWNGLIRRDFAGGFALRQRPGRADPHA